MRAAWTLVAYLWSGEPARNPPTASEPPARPFWPDSVAIDARTGPDVPGPERLRALELLAARAGDETMPILRGLLADPDPGVRLFVTRRLIRAGDPAGIDAAAARIVAPGAPAVDRQLGLELLRDAPTLPPAGRTLAERALHDADPAVRAAAVDVLRRHGAGGALSAILACFDDDNREVRLRAVRVVAATRDERAALSLLGAVDDGDRQVRVEAVRALGGYPRALPVLLRLAQANGPGDVGAGADEVRTAAIEALAALRAEAAVPVLAELARRRPPDDLARHAQLALGQIATPAATAVLISLAGTPPVADEVREGLRRAGGAAVAPLLRLLEQGTPTAASVAIAVLGEIGDRRATLPLCAQVGRRAELAPLAIAALAALADPDAVPTLVRAAASPVLEIRRRAHEALLALRDPRAEAVLERGLVDPDGQVRGLAIRIGLRFDARQMVPALAALTSDPDPTVRRAAAPALAQLALPAPPIAKAILARLARPDAPARDDDEWAAIGAALAQLARGEPRLLDTAASTASGPSRIAIARALAAVHERAPLTDRTVIGRLITALDEGGSLALAAADALAAAHLPDSAAGALARVFGAAPPALRARLCPAIAATSRGAAWLAAVVAAPDEAISVRAAAAWAARGLPDAAPALRAVSDGIDDPDEAIVANARAALAVRDRDAATAWSEVRLRAPDGGALAERWVALTTAGGVVWMATDSAGVVRLNGLPEGPLAFRLAEPAKATQPDAARPSAGAPWSLAAVKMTR